MNKIEHPAKFSKPILDFLDKRLPVDGIILDVFAGVGTLRNIRKSALLIEIEPEWGKIGGAIIGDSRNLPFLNKTIDCVCTSPTYGNRMADSFTDHQKEKKYKRNTYTHKLGRKLTNGNSGCLHFGEEYKKLHERVWLEVSRVLKRNGLFYLNISNFIKNGKEVDVCSWHKNFIVDIGFSLESEHEIKTKRNGFGANRNARVGHEMIYIFKNLF